jgi:hypothetical protein
MKFTMPMGKTRPLQSSPDDVKSSKSHPKKNGYAWAEEPVGRGLD